MLGLQASAYISSYFYSFDQIISVVAIEILHSFT